MKIMQFINTISVRGLFIIPVLFMIIIPTKGWSYLNSSFDINVGQSSFQANTASNTKTVDSFSTLELNYNLKHSSMGLAYCMSFFEIINSKDGYLTFTRFSVGPRWYPRGMNGGRVIIDNDVQARVWRATPFIGMNLGISNLSVKEYNASLIDLTPRFGVEIPLTAKVLLLGQFIVSTSLSSSSSGESKDISYQGSSAMLGIVISNFGE